MALHKFGGYLWAAFMLPGWPKQRSKLHPRGLWCCLCGDFPGCEVGPGRCAHIRGLDDLLGRLLDQLLVGEVVGEIGGGSAVESLDLRVLEKMHSH